MSDLRSVKFAARERSRSEERFKRTVREAVKAGHSMISVAEAANVTRQRVFQIVKEEEK